MSAFVSLLILTDSIQCLFEVDVAGVEGFADEGGFVPLRLPLL